MDLNGRKALVTGGAGHIGFVAVKILLEMGSTVCILDNNQKSIDQKLQILTSNNRLNVGSIVCDLRDEMETRNAVNQAIALMDGLDILVHCAAYVGTTGDEGWAVPFKYQTVQAWDNALNTNLTSVFVMAQEGEEALSKTGHGSIVLFSSIYGMVGPDMRLYDNTDMANPAGYGATKGGVIQFARFLATTLAPKIRVNCISPGGLERAQAESFKHAYTYRTPLKRMATEEDLQGAVAYLCSDLSAYVTGHNLVGDGGWTAW